MKTPEGAAATAIGLSVAAAGFLVAGVATNDSSKFADTIASFQSVVNNYYNSLSSSQQSAFATSFTTGIQTMLSGGMMVPQVDSSGQITGYGIDIPTTIAPQSDGSTLYTFASGITLQQGANSIPGPLQTSATSGESIWTIPQGGSAVESVGLFQNGSYSDTFKDNSGNSVAEVYIAGSSGTYTVSSSGTTFVNETGSNVTVNAASGSLVNVQGSGNSTNVSDAMVQVSSGFTTTITGNIDTISAGANTITALYGTGGIVNFVPNSGSLVNLCTANSSDTVTGAGNTVGVFAGGDSITASGETFNFSTTGFSTNITGSNDIVNAAAYSTTGILGGTNDVFNLGSNSGATVNFGASSGGTVNGTGNTIGICGSGDSVNASGETFNFMAAGYSTNITGNSDIINAGTNSFTALFGTGSIVNFVPNSGSLVNLYTANSSTTVNGTGNTVGILASGDSIYASGNTFNFSTTGVDTNITGNNDIMNAGAGSTTGITGTGETFNLVSNSGSIANFGANSNGTVNGTGNVIGVCGSGDGINASGETFYFAAGGYSTAIVGNNDVIDAAAASSTGITGTGEIFNLVSNSGSTANFGANSGGTVNGTGNVIGVCGSGDSITASGETFYFAAGGYGTSIAGSNDIINTAPNSATGITGTNETFNLVSNSGSTVNFQANSGGTVNGTGNVIGICGSGGSITTGGNTVDTVSGVSFNLGGGNDTVNLSGTGDYLGLIGGNGYQVSATGSTVNTISDTSFTLSGSHNTVGLGANSAVAVNGSGNIVNAGTNSVVLDNGVNNTINATNSVIQLGSQNIGQTVYINGNGNTIDASTLFWQGASMQTTVVVRGTANTIYANPGAMKINLNDTMGNFVVGQSVAVYTNNANSFTRGPGPALSGTYGPLNPAAPSTPGVYFPDYDPAAGGTGGSFTNGGVWNGDPDISGQLPMYDIPLNDCTGSGYNADGIYNVVVCGGGNLGTTSPALLSASTGTQTQSLVAPAATSSARTAAPVSLPAFSGTQDNVGFSSMSTSTDGTDTQDALNATGLDQGQAIATDINGGADTVATQLQSLIAAMATFAADSSATTTLAAPAENDPQMLLAASAY